MFVEKEDTAGLVVDGYWGAREEEAGKWNIFTRCLKLIRFKNDQ